jgi:CheY-like chemotaxis protein
MSEIKILWADDEIDMLKPQVMFLEGKGYNVVTVSNGYDALEECADDDEIDIVFLDESMPGLTGLETLTKIKEKYPNMPVVMITKNEAESIMEEAIGSQITDYLIKPVKPQQIIMTLRKVFDGKRLVREKTRSDYQQDFRQIFTEINSDLSFSEWADVYRKIINWELKLDASQTTAMADILAMQKQEANAEFSKYIIKNYMGWIGDKEESPILSHNLLRNRVFPYYDENVPTVLLVMDNLRYDQWKVIEPILSELYKVEDEDYFYSILPTSTQYSRNSIFAGLTPLEIQEYYPEWWRNDNEEGGKNLFEKELMGEQLRRTFQNPPKFDYIKVTNVGHGKILLDNALNYLNNDLTVIVYNFIDMLSHARTEMEVLKELASDESAYRSLTRSWFLHSPLWEALQKMAERDIQLFITTDHGTIRVQTPSRVVGDRETTTNLRYKVGRNLQYDKRDILEVRTPAKAQLPTPNVSSTFIFAKEDKFFLYPNNYNYYNNYYKNTFQHGGISLEEMICPIITLYSK